MNKFDDALKAAQTLPAEELEAADISATVSVTSRVAGSVLIVEVDLMAFAAAMATCPYSLNDGDVSHAMAAVSDIMRTATAIAGHRGLYARTVRTSTPEWEALRAKLDAANDDKP